MKTLIIVDVQAAFPVPPSLVRRIRTYAGRFDCRVFTRFVNLPGSLFRTKLKQSSCAPGSPDLELLIAPVAGDIVIDKPSYGLSARAIQRLRRRGVKEATVCGVDTDACVLGVMFSLFDAGIDPKLHASLCWSSSDLQTETLKIVAHQFMRPRGSGAGR